jgi:RNA recognition motif-containing protein
LYVGNLADSTDDAKLRAAFASWGEILALRIVSDADSGASRGFGFVEYGTDEEAGRALATLNGTDLEGRALNIKLARPLMDKSRGPQQAVPLRRPAKRAAKK